MAYEVVHEYIVIVVHNIATRVSEWIIVGSNIMIANPVFEEKVMVTWVLIISWSIVELSIINVQMFCQPVNTYLILLCFQK